MRLSFDHHELTRIHHLTFRVALRLRFKKLLHSLTSQMICSYGYKYINIHRMRSVNVEIITVIMV